MSADDAIENALATGIRKASDENGSFENFSLKDMVAARKFLDEDGAKTDPFSAVRKARMIAAGTQQ